MDQSMQHAVGRLLATKCFPGRVIKLKDGNMIMEECIPNRAKLLPTFILFYVLGIAGPLSAIAGFLYAWSYNRNGRRMPLIAKEDPPRLDRPR